MDDTSLTFSELVNLLIAELSSVKRAIIKLTEFTENLLLENKATRNIHADLMRVIQELSLVQSELPNLLNSLVSMVDEVSLMTNSIHSPIAELREENKVHYNTIIQKIVETQQLMSENFANVIRRLDQHINNE